MFVTIWQRKETACYQKKRPQEKSYNQQQNELRHFALKGLFDVLLTSKGKNIAFPPPSPPCNVAPLFELPIENNKTPQLWDRGGVWILLFSEVTLFEYNVSTILSLTVQKTTSIVIKKNLAHCLNLHLVIMSPDALLTCCNYHFFRCKQVIVGFNSNCFSRPNFSYSLTIF